MAHSVKDVDPGGAKALMEAGWRVVDVRTDAEWAEGHIAGSQHVPMNQVVEDIGDHLDHPLLVVCASGGRSSRVADYLALQGLEAANLVGGLHAWEAAGLPIEH
ncbi:MAG TPA: rhodanese-like domain-containing protein [Friedmanniella sp.]